MSSLRIVIGVIWVVLVLVSGRIWTASAVSITPVPVVEQSGATTSVAERRVDMYGNEVAHAVTEYRIDVRGDLYEHHAPQTALPRPKRPGA